MSLKNKCKIACENLRSQHGFIILKPSSSINSHIVAKEIAMCEGVKEVALTTGEFGFVVRVESRIGIEGIKRKISAITHSKKASILVKHFSYRNTIHNSFS
ncbi:MAG: hypothetical protein ACREBF_00540 [Candidatus Micrarchaeales archaeon]